MRRIGVDGDREMLTFELTMARPTAKSRWFGELSSTSLAKSVFIDGSSDLP
jgi:hypothetical protein